MHDPAQRIRVDVIRMAVRQDDRRDVRKDSGIDPSVDERELARIEEQSLLADRQAQAAMHELVDTHGGRSYSDCLWTTGPIASGVPEAMTSQRRGAPASAATT